MKGPFLQLLVSVMSKQLVISIELKKESPPLTSKDVIIATRATLSIIQRCTIELRANKPFTSSEDSAVVWNSIDHCLEELNKRSILYDTEIKSVMQQLGQLQQMSVTRLPTSETELDALDKPKRQQKVKGVKRDINKCRELINKVRQSPPLSDFISKFRQDVKVAGTNWSKAVQSIDKTFIDIVSHYDAEYEKILSPKEEVIHNLTTDLNALNVSLKQEEVTFWKKRLVLLEKRNNVAQEKEEEAFAKVNAEDTYLSIFTNKMKNVRKENLDIRHEELSKRAKEIEGKYDAVEEEYKKAQGAFLLAQEQAVQIQKDLTFLRKELHVRSQEKLKAITAATERAKTDRQNLDEAVKYFGVNESLTELLSTISNFEAVSDHGLNVHSKLLAFFDSAVDNIESLVEELEEGDWWNYENRLAILKDPQYQPFLEDKDDKFLLLKY